MLSKLTIENFRCFEKSTIPLKQLSIVVGANNNAGKSTVIEALRLVSVVVNRLGRLAFHPVPDWLSIPKAYKGMSPSMAGQPIKFRGIFHQYNEPPAKITAAFAEGCRIEVHLGENGQLHAVCFDGDDGLVTTQARAGALRLGRIAILPQIGPVREEETILSQDHVRASLDSSLASLHFRNQIHLLYDSVFARFKSLAESTWPTLQVMDLKGRGRASGDPLELLIRNQDFVGEVALMGHGLQMWLQTMWFIARAMDSETLILDEPDVYMHADLQRRLIRFLRNRQPQLIIATHSIEIMGEVEPEEVLVVDRGRRKARFASDLATLDEVVNRIGGIHNLQLARLWNAKRCLFVEGKDVPILKRIEDVLFPDSTESIEVLPRISVGGWGGWHYVVGSSMLLDKNISEDFIKYCIFDRDYHLDEHIDERNRAAKGSKIDLHIWRRKEIENYLLCASAISRLISRRGDGKHFPSEDRVQAEIDRITENMKNQVLDAFAQEHLSVDRSGGAAAANKFGRERIGNWHNSKARARIVGGKDVISKLSSWAKRKYDVSFGPETIASEMHKQEVPSELAEVVTAIHDGERLS
jgi:hypothetical protein